ncbi:MAG: phenylalanine--tRNA ligase subunit beta, partial [Phycisphaerae bacterium]
MQLSRQWLERYVALDGKSDSELEEALTLIGFEVEGIEHFGLPPIQNLVVGQVLSREPHPNADRLGVCSVDAGESQPRQIVCGASNYKVGDKVPVALPGAVLPGDFKIKESKLRGVESAGMMCSARELGLGKDHEGLLILGGDPAPGTPLSELFEGQDTIFDIEVTPNRPDCLSHLGMARELAAYFDRELRFPEVKTSANDPFREVGEPLIERVRVESEEECPLYYAFSMRGVKIGPSPDWLKRALESVGLRPINNVVDVTNFVLLETGQPLHAFDAAKIQGGELRVRQARKGEKLITLDDKARELSTQMTVIADAERPLVIAGVMGSVDAEVDNSTTDIVLEAAFFRSRFIRQTSRRLALSTDSSYRFERGVDPAGTEWAACRAMDLILEVAGGQISGGPIQVGEPPEIRAEIVLCPDEVRRLCGFGPEDAVVRQTLERLELEVRELDRDAEGRTRWNVAIPSFRRDLERPVDLVEEFLRI